MLNLLARGILGFDCSIGCHLIFGCTLLLFELYPCAFCMPFIPRRGYSHALFLSREPVWFCGLFCEAVSLKAGSFGIGSCTAAIGEIVLVFVSHICVPLDVSS